MAAWFVRRVAADECTGVAGVSLLRAVAAWWVLDCSTWEIFRNTEDTVVRGTATVLINEEFGAFVHGAGARVLGGYATADGRSWS